MIPYAYLVITQAATHGKPKLIFDRNAWRHWPILYDVTEQFIDLL